ncbi:MAG: FHA domain-containing protein [Polyangiales bacterium]
MTQESQVSLWVAEEIATPAAEPLLIRPMDLGCGARGAFRTEVSHRQSGGSFRRLSEEISALRPGCEVLSLKKRPGGLFPRQIGLGRTANVDLRIVHPSISKYHAFFVAREGGWQLSDASSKNGTFLDGERLVPKTPIVLPDQARIRFGEVELFFLLPEAVSRYASEASRVRMV